MNNPVSKANVVALSREPLLFVGRTYGLQTVSEWDSLSNYLTLLRAVNPTRKYVVSDNEVETRIFDGLNQKKSSEVNTKLQAEALQQLGLAGPADQIQGNAGRFISLMASFHPVRTLQIAREVAEFEENYALDRKSVV